MIALAGCAKAQAGQGPSTLDGPDLGERGDEVDIDSKPLDRDRDGIQDLDDECPEEAEDADGDRDHDGCREQGDELTAPPRP